MINPRRIVYRVALLCVSALGGISYGESSTSVTFIDPPVPVPAGDSGFVGSTKVGFNRPVSGRISYSLDDGTSAANNWIDYAFGTTFVIDHTLTLKAVHIRTGIASDTVAVRFVRAQMPAPIAAYGSSTNFYPSITCTLATGKPGLTPSIYYTTDGSVPTTVSKLYSGPLTFTKSTVLRSMETYAGYDASDPMEVDFTYLAPTAAPTILPAGKTFASKSIVITLKTVTSGAVVRYSTDTTANLDTAAIAAGDSISLQGDKINEPIVLRAQAFKTNFPPSPIVTETYVYLPPAAMPVPSRAPGIFYDNMTLRFTSTTTGAFIRYNHGTTPPTTASSDTAVISIAGKSDTITAIAFNPPQPQSQAFSGIYTLKLSPPAPDLPSRQFRDSLNVFLTSPCPGALIYYTLDGTTPTINSALFNTGAPQVPVSISKDSTTLTAIAVKGTVMSDVSKNLYTKSAGVPKLADPLVSPTSRQFTDSLQITLGTGDSDAEIRYTEDGSNPTATSKLYQDPFFIDSTTTLHSRAFPTRVGFAASGTREEIYTLLPSPPVASPSANRSYPDSVLVTLTTTTMHGVIYYILGDQVLDLGFMQIYRPGQAIPIRRSGKLQAITVLVIGPDTLKSFPLSQTYDIYASLTTDTMAVNTTRSLPGGYTFTNASANPILAKLITTDGLGLTGFKEPGVAVQIRPVQSGQPVTVTFSKPPDQPNALYRVTNGKVEFVSASLHADIPFTGDYFAGIDTLPPTISILSQIPKAGDSTTVRFSIKDNVASPNCEIQSEGLPGGKLSRHPDSAGVITAAFKNSGSTPASLWLRTQASDFFNTSRLPKDSLGKFFLTQSFGSLSIPPVLSLGRQAYPWDLAGMPLSAKSPITWGRVRKDNPGVDLYAMILKDSINYLSLTDDSLIRPGMAFWLGSTKTTSALSLSKFQSGESETDGSYRITLHHGWNQISDPALEKMYWPFSRKDPKYRQFTIKGLHEFVPNIIDYAETDSLSPWKGYFVYSYGAKDTLVILYPKSAQPGLPKAAAFPGTESVSAGPSLQLSLDFGRPIPLILGADLRAEDGFENEDEVQLPAWKPDFAAWSQRGRHKLTTDMLRFASQSVFRWDVVVSDSTLAHGHVRGTEAMRVLEGRLPAGYQAWAVFKTRGMKFRIEEGASVPMGRETGDTLTIFAGPLAKLTEIPELAKAVVAVEKFAFDLRRDAAGGYSVNLSLPWDCRVDMSVLSLTGRLLFESHPGELVQGVYRLPLGIGARKNPQLGVLRVLLRGESVDRQISQKVLW